MGPPYVQHMHLQPFKGYPLGLEAVKSLPNALEKPSIVMGYLEDIGLERLAETTETHRKTWIR